MNADESRSKALPAIALAALGLIVLWSIDLFVLNIPVLTPLDTPSFEQPALSPIYAFVQPALRWTTLLFPLCVGLLIWRTTALTGPDTTSRWWFTLQLLAVSLLLPLSLFLVRELPSNLGGNLTYYENEEVYDDARKITDLADFYRHYVKRIPELSLHGRHFPPGHATLLYLLARVFGSGTLVAGIFVITCFCAGMVCVYRALACQLDERRARQGALLCLACPSCLDFACTSMNAVFFAAAALSLWLAFAALARPKNVVIAILAGSSLLVAILLSYSALPLGLAIGLFAALKCRRGAWQPMRAILIMGACFAALTLCVALLTGFSVPEHFIAAFDHNVDFMTTVIGRHPGGLYLLISYGNAAAFLIGSGVAVTGALLLRLIGPCRFGGRLSLAFAAVLAVLVFGNIHQMETERIWIYAVPWVVFAALEPGALSPTALRLLLAAGLAQAFAMEVLLFTLW